MGLPDPPGGGSTIKPRRPDHLRLLLGRAGGLVAPLAPSRREVMASVGCCRLPDALAGSLDQFAAPLFSAGFNRAGSMVSVACQDATISLFDTDQLLYRAAAKRAAVSGRGPLLPPLRPRKEIQCQVCMYVACLCGRKRGGTRVA